MDTTNSNDYQKKKSRKKKKSVLSNARKYAKKGQLGRGTKMEEDTYQYFVGILEVMKDGLDTEEETAMMVNNVLERTVGDEINIVGNQLGCRLIELLLPHSSPADLERYITVVSEDLRRLCSDNFSSHVIETLLRVSSQRATDHLQTDQGISQDDGDSNNEEVVPTKKRKVENVKKSKYTEEHITKCNEFTLKVGRYALNNLEDFVWDPYANHILRSAIKCLSGITMMPGEKAKKNIFKNADSGNILSNAHTGKLEYKVVTDEYKSIVKDCASRLSQWPQFKDLPYENLTSGLVQVLLFGLRNVDKQLLRHILKQILDDSFVPNNWVNEDLESKDDKKAEDLTEDGSAALEVERHIPPVFESDSAVRLLEAALAVAKKKSYTQIYAKCFINRLHILVTNSKLNFAVQRLFDNCHIAEEFESMFEELSSKFGSILACGNTGVLVAVAKACHRLKSKQTQFIANLESALNCAEPRENQKHFAILCLRLLPLDRVDLQKQDSKGYFINVHGSVILQTILGFLRPSKASNSLMETPSEELVRIFEDAKGCHVADAFFESQYVGVKARDKMIWKLKGFYQQLAMSQYGSRAFEVIFKTASPEQQIKIMTEVADKGQILNSTMYGRVIAAKYNVELFNVSADRWKAAQQKSEKNNNMFKDIIKS